jgi:hypothetical protein
VQVIDEAQTLYRSWGSLPFDAKRQIVETVVGRIVVGKGEVDIDLTALVPGRDRTAPAPRAAPPIPPKRSRKGPNSQGFIAASSEKRAGNCRRARARTTLTVPAEERPRRVASLVAEIDAQAAARREKTGIPSMGAVAILAQDPHHRPRHTKRSPAPFCHAASKGWRQRLRDAYKEFVDDFRRAAERLKVEKLAIRYPRSVIRLK